MTACRVCGSVALAPLWSDADGFAWHRCADCGSDTSEATYRADGYGGGYVASLLAAEGNDPAANHQHTADLLARHAPRPGRLLDVGCGAGTTVGVLWDRGWQCWTWDVSGEGRPPGTAVSPQFRAAARGPRYDAVLCREVLEHTPGPHRLLRELYAATRPGGLLQITTPRPQPSGESWQCYQGAHLALWSVPALRVALRTVGYDLVESDVWELGQRHVCRRPA